MGGAATFLAGSIVAKLMLDKSGFSSGMQSVTKDLKSAGGMSAQTATAFRGVGAALTIAGAAIVGVLGSMVKAAEEEGKVERQLDAVLKSTAGAAGLNREEMIKLADEMSRVTKYTHEEVTGGENLLLTFTRIGKDVMPQAVETMLDMSTALGQDLKSSAIQLGKALQDPVLGITALRRVGVNFDADAKNMITTLVKQGHTLEAQKVILKELAVEFGGSARMAVQGFGGQLGLIKKDIMETGESIGKSLMPFLKDMLASIKPIVEKLRAWVEAHPELVRQIATLALKLGMAMVVIGPLLIALPRLVQIFGILKIAVTALAGPLGITIAVVAAAGAAINGLINKYKEKQDAEIAALVKTGNAMGEYNKLRQATIKGEIATQKEWQDIVKRFGGDYTKVMQGISTLPEYADIKKKWDEIKVKQVEAGTSTSDLKGEYEKLAAQLQDAQKAEDAFTKFMQDVGIKTLEQKRERINEINGNLKILEGLLKNGKITQEDYDKAVKSTNEELWDLGYYTETAIPPAKNLMDAVRKMPSTVESAVYAYKTFEEQIKDLADEFMVSENTIVKEIYNIRREILALAGINIPPLDFSPIEGGAKTATDNTRNYFDGLYNDIATGFGDSASGLIGDICKGLNFADGKFFEHGINFKKYFLEAFATAKDAFFKMIGEMVSEKVLGLFKGLFESVGKAGKEALGGIADVAGNLGKSAGGIASGLLSSLGSIGSIVTAITSVLNLFKGPQKQTDVTYWLKFIKDNSQILVNYMTADWAGLKTALCSLPGKLDLVNDFLRGISDKIGAIVVVSVPAAGGGETAPATPPGGGEAGEGGEETPTTPPAGGGEGGGATVPGTPPGGGAGGGGGKTKTPEIGFQKGFEGLIKKPVKVTMGEVPEYAYIQPLNKQPQAGREIRITNYISVTLDPMSDRRMMRQRFIPEFLAAMDANFMKSLFKQQLGA